MVNAKLRIAAIGAAAFTFACVPHGVAQDKSDTECARTAQMDVYSNASVFPESGDLEGFELAFDQPRGSARPVLLYFYEGAESEGIPLRAITIGDKIVIRGTWNERLIEYPTKKEIVQKHAVEIAGTLSAKMFLGNISIEGLEIANAQKLRLKRVRHIWSCAERSRH